MSAAPPGPQGRSRAPDRRPGGRAPVAALIGILVVAGLLLWVVSAIQSHNALQNCIDSGRKDCLDLR